LKATVQEFDGMSCLAGVGDEPVESASENHEPTPASWRPQQYQANDSYVAKNVDVGEPESRSGDDRGERSAREERRERWKYYKRGPFRNVIATCDSTGEASDSGRDCEHQDAIA
jgi:hypothetical protein